jgi:hypothetical protein
MILPHKNDSYELEAAVSITTASVFNAHKTPIFGVMKRVSHKKATS